MKYSIENLTLKYQDKSWMEIIDELSKEVRALDRVYNKLKYPLDYEGERISAYRKYAGDLLFYLNCGVIPAGIGIEGMQNFIPIIKNLVDKGHLKNEALNKLITPS